MDCVKGQHLCIINNLIIMCKQSWSRDVVMYSIYVYSLVLSTATGGILPIIERTTRNCAWEGY